MACNPMIFGLVCHFCSYWYQNLPIGTGNDNDGKGNMSNDLMSRGYIMNSFGALGFRIIWLLLIYIFSLWKAILYEDISKNIAKRTPRALILSLQSTSVSSFSGSTNSIQMQIRLFEQLSSSRNPLNQHF